MQHVQRLEQRVLFDAGRIDTTFAQKGTLTFDLTAPFGAGSNVADSSMAQDSGGRIFVTVAGTDAADQKKIAITRLTRDGLPDPSYGNNGVCILDRALDIPEDAQWARVYVDQNNRAYIRDGMTLWRLTPSGKIDRTFGRRGKM